MRYKLAIFDFDGTLADSFDAFLLCLNETARLYGFRPIPPDGVDEARGMSSRELMAHLGVPFWKVPALAMDMRWRMMGRIGLVQPFPGAEATLRALAGQGVELALLTSNTRDAVRAVLGDETMGLFGHVHCNAAMFGKRFKLRELQWTTRRSPDQVICIGDEIRDAEAARAVGMDFIGVAWGYTRPDVLQAHCPQPLADSFDALAQHLAGAGSARG